MNRKKLLSLLCPVLIVVCMLSMISVASAAEGGYEAGDVLSLGTYPQAHITDEALINNLNAAAADSEWKTIPYAQSGSLELVKYSDIKYEDTMYRRIRILQSLSSATAQNGYNTGVVYWFRFEPIHWILLDADSGFAIADMVLDAEPFTYPGYMDNGIYYTDSSGAYYMNNYAQSDIRVWLNDTFLSTAFSPEEAAVLNLHTSDNSIVPAEACEPFICEDTTDYVSLLSLEETSYFSGDADAVRNATDYALALGCNNYGLTERSQYWFLRTPGQYSNNNCYLSPHGRYGLDVLSDSPDVGIVPTVYLSLSDYAALNEEKEVFPEYDGFTFSFHEGILTVSGSGELPSAPDSENAPLAAYAEDCKVIVLEDGVTSVNANAFPKYENLEIVILNGDVTLHEAAFSDSAWISSVICKTAVEIEENAFQTNEGFRFYENETYPHTGNLPEKCDYLPYSFADDTLSIAGNVEMDAYDLLDLMTVMCSYYDDIRYVRFDSYTAIGFPFYVYDKGEDTYVLAEDNMLKGVRFSVKIEGEEDWETITFNDFCALAAEKEITSFHLVADLETGEDVQETSMSLVDRIQTVIKRVLKWMTSLLNTLFKLLSIFK